MHEALGSLISCSSSAPTSLWRLLQTSAEEAAGLRRWEEEGWRNSATSLHRCISILASGLAFLLMNCSVMRSAPSLSRHWEYLGKVLSYSIYMGKEQDQ